MRVLAQKSVVPQGSLSCRNKSFVLGVCSLSRATGILRLKANWIGGQGEFECREWDEISTHPQVGVAEHMLTRIMGFKKLPHTTRC